MPDFAALLRQAARDADNTPPPPGTLPADFAEEPVSLTRFVQDKQFLNNPPLSPVQYDAVRHIERVYYNGWFHQADGTMAYSPDRDTYRLLGEHLEAGHRPDRLHVGAHATWREEKYWSTAVRMTNFATLQWGKGGGKDHICRVASMRIAYLLLCLDSPTQYYALPDQDSIHLLNVASSSGQAQQAFFMPIVRAVKKGWFAGRCEPKQNVISYDKNIESISGHSDAETQEGLNLLLGIADEIDAFKSKAEMATRRGASAREPTKSAEGILNMMRTSGATRFPEVFKQVRISFPRYLGSTIQKLTVDAQKDVNTKGVDSRHYVSGPLATWEVNPRVKGKEAFAGDYEDDPVMARAKYECRPGRAINPYFRNHQAVDAAFRVVDTAPVAVDYQLEGATGRKVWAVRYRFAEDFWPIRGAQYAMHADLAVSGDRAGVAMAHVASWSEHELDAEDEDGAPHPIREIRPHVAVDFVLSFEADATAAPAREIQIRWARQLAFELIRRGFAVRRFSFDSFQSKDSMQILESKNIECEKVSTDTSEDPWRTLRDLMSEGRVTVPRLDGPSLLRDELLSLTRLPNGRVDHPSDGSKDMADALACAVLGAVVIGGAEQDNQERAYVGTTEFATGSVFELPIGVNVDRVWQREMPSPF